ncbi:MAG: inositol monophosphatase [Candidatus Aminicenantes bacterium]|nr:inositol monophosphatase [Candidatus Aminicenantes bacterium]
MSPYHSVALRAVQRAGAAILRGFRMLTDSDIEVKGKNDFVTRVDREAEAAIVEVISGAFPSHRILAEESGYSRKSGESLWVIDPLDGTTNFIHGIPHFAVSLALLKNEKVIFGLIYDPLAGDIFHADRGCGAFLNGRPITVSRTTALASALGATGFPFKAPEQRPAYTRTFRCLLGKCKDMRRCGAAALDMAYTACGRYDFFWEAHLLPWDFMAGKLLVAEAGGASSDFLGNELGVHPSTVLAANKALYPAVLKEIGRHFK